MTTMDLYTATGLAEGFIEAKDEAEVIEAWQLLINSGMAWKLQGWFGRTARDLIEAGICAPPPQQTHYAPTTVQ
jgi:hypothetical protein